MSTYVFKPGIWLAGSIGQSFMGQTILNGEEKDNPQNNSRYGLAFAIRLNKHHALKAIYSNGLSTRYGARFASGLIAYQYIWFDRKKNRK